MLPTFRVRGVRPVDDPTSTRAKVAADGIIRLRKEDYDELLKVHPEAALRYLDEDDGDIILVGSGFELDQRLKEPVGFDSAAGISARLKGDGPMHTFEVKRQPDVIGAWRGMDALTQAMRERSNRASIVEGKKKVTSTIGFETSDRNRQVRFGQASPLSLNAPTMMKATFQDDEHVNRWSSYIALPSSFDQKPHDFDKALPQTNVEANPSRVNAKIAESLKQEPSTETMSLMDAFLNNDISATKLKKESKPTNQPSDLVDLQPDNGKPSEKHQPLMKMFEAELHKLAASSPGLNSTGVQTNNSISKNKNASTSTDNKSLQTNLNSTTLSGSNSHMDSISVGEICVISIQSIMNGLSLLATGLTEPRLKEHVKDALPQIQAMKDKIQYCTEEVNKLNKIALPDPPAVNLDVESSKQMSDNIDPPTDLDANTTGSRPSNPSQVPPPQQLWKVERVIGKRFIRYNSDNGPRIVQYLVRWVGCGPSDDMWYDEENLLDCREMIEKFETGIGIAPVQSKDLVSSDASKPQSRPKEAQDAAHLHIRTAGDGMVVWKERCSPKVAESPVSKPSKETKVSFVEQLSAGPEAALLKPKAHQHIQQVLIPHDEEAATTQQKKLRHRASWHPVSSNTDGTERKFDFSPVSILKRYPSVGQIPKHSGRLPTSSSAYQERSSMKSSSSEPRRTRSLLFNPVLSSSPSPADWWTLPFGEALQRNTSAFEPAAQRKKGILKTTAGRDNTETSPATSSNVRTSATFATPEVRSKSSNGITAVKECAKSMIDMGYTQSQAETAALEAGGDLLEAIDLLEEDRKAWEKDIPNVTESRSSRPNEPLPGSWDEELYG